MRGSRGALVRRGVCGAWGCWPQATGHRPHKGPCSVPCGNEPAASGQGSTEFGPALPLELEAII